MRRVIVRWPAGRVGRMGLVALLAAVGWGASPAFASGANCLFQAKGLALGFGTLDPSSGVTVTRAATVATANANQVGDCPASRTMVFSADNGQHFGSGSRRLANGTDFIPYSLTLPASRSGPGNGAYVTFVISGTILPSDYQNASAGAYSDSVTITVSP